MKVCVHAIRMLVVASVLAIPYAALAKNTRPNRAYDVFPTLRTGQWIRVVGVVMKDRSVRCTELKVLAGDFLDDDWGLTGQIEAVDVPGGRLMIAHIPVLIGENAVLESTYGHYESLAEIKPGMIVEVDGTYMKDGTFLAHDLDDESDEFELPPGERRLRIVGKVEQMDPSRRRIQVMGTVFFLTDGTQVKSLIR